MKSFFIKYSVFLSVALASFLVVISTHMRLGLILILLGLLGYMVSDTLNIGAQLKMQHKIEPYKLALIQNSLYFVVFFLCIIAGAYIGLQSS